MVHLISSQIVVQRVGLDLSISGLLSVLATDACI
jgi:hypothetical protein